MRFRQLMRVYVDLVAQRSAATYSARQSGSLACGSSLGTPRLLGAEHARWVLSSTDGVEDFLDLAERYFDGEFQLLGYPTVVLERPIDYSTDPFSGRSWPKRHGLKIDYRRASYGDPKWIWELNRLQHVPLLLAAWRLQGHERFRRVALDDLEAWSSQFQPGVGIAWSNGFEPALRAISLALALDALRDHHHAPPPGQEDLTRVLAYHLAWIQRYPSLYSSGNNHRIGELAGTLVAMALVPQLYIEATYQRALLELEGITATLFLSDGGYAEQSFAYAVFVIDLLLLVSAACSASAKVDELNWLDGALWRAGDALALQLGDDGPDPDYGDRDDGRAFALDGNARRGGRAVCAALAAHTGHPGARAIARKLDSSAAWLFGRSAVRRFSITQPAMPPGCGWLEDTGLAIFRAGDTRAVLDVGPLGWGKLAAHGHSDALQVTIHHGRDILVGDPGTGSYYGSSEVRDAFRGTGFHPTLLVDGTDQAVSAGPFLWTTRPQVKRITVDLSRRVATASHNGYHRLSDPVTHRRTLVLLDEGLVMVRDGIQSASEHSLCQRWPMAPGYVVNMIDGENLRVRGPQDFIILCQATNPIRTTVWLGSLEPFRGWWSDRLESIQPAPLVSLDTTAKASTEIVTIISVGPHSFPPVLEVDDVGTAHIRKNGVEYHVEAESEDDR